MPPAELKRLALLMAVNCVRNTVIEDYHADGKLSDEEMKVFNQEVANEIYTFLRYMTNQLPEDQAAFLSAMGILYPSDWDQPKLDASFVKSVNLAKKMKIPIDKISTGLASRSPKKLETKKKEKR